MVTGSDDRVVSSSWTRDNEAALELEGATREACPPPTTAEVPGGKEDEIGGMEVMVVAAPRRRRTSGFFFPASSDRIAGRKVVERR